MLLFDDHNHPIILDNIHGPTVTEYMWVLDLSIMDFTLTPLLMLEEVYCPSIQFQINGFEFILPADWNILVCDAETTQLDVVELSEAAGREFTAVVYGPTCHQPDSAGIIVTNYFIEHKNVGPSLNKHQMLMHPVGADVGVMVGPSDVFNKYLKGKMVGDLT
jgi:hypothetical protein